MSSEILFWNSLSLPKATLYVFFTYCFIETGNRAKNQNRQRRWPSLERKQSVVLFQPFYTVPAVPASSQQLTPALYNNCPFKGTCLTTTTTTPVLIRTLLILLPLLLFSGQCSISSSTSQVARYSDICRRRPASSM